MIRIKLNYSGQRSFTVILHSILIKLKIYIFSIINVKIKSYIVINVFSNVLIDWTNIKNVLHGYMHEKDLYLYGDSISLHNLGKSEHNFLMHRPHWSKLLLEQYNYLGDVIIQINPLDEEFLSKELMVEKIKKFDSRKIVKTSEVLYTQKVNHKFKEKEYSDIITFFNSRPKFGFDRNDKPDISVIIPTTLNTVKHNFKKIELTNNILHNINNIINSKLFGNIELIVVIGPEINNKNYIQFKNQIKNIGIKTKYITDQYFYSYSRRINLALEEMTYQNILLLNDDVIISNPNQIWIGINLLKDPNVASVSFTLMNSEKLITHAGVSCEQTLIDEYLKGTPASEIRPEFLFAREVSANSFACVLVRSETFQKVGLLDEDLPIEFNDVEWCLRCENFGLTHIVLPGGELYHELSLSRDLTIVPVLDAEYIATAFSLPIIDKYKITIPFCCFSREIII